MLWYPFQTHGDLAVLFNGRNVQPAAVPRQGRPNTAQLGNQGNSSWVWGCCCVCPAMSLQSCVQLFATVWTVTLQAPLSMGFSRQESWIWVAIAFFRGSSWPRDQIHISCIADRFFTVWATRELSSIGDDSKRELYTEDKWTLPHTS